MRVLLTSIGTAGDIHPFIAVGLALRARGHDVLFLANPYYKPRILNAGLGFWPLGELGDQQRLAANADLVRAASGPEVVLRDLMLPAIHSTAASLPDAIRVFRADVVLAHHISLAAGPICRKMSVPLAHAVLAPLMWLSRREPIVYPTMPWADPPKVVDAAFRLAMTPVGRFRWDWPINRALRRHNLPTMQDIALRSARGGHHAHARSRPLASLTTPVLGLWSPIFRPALADDPLKGVICGFCVYDRPPESAAEQPLAELIRWIDDAPPPVLVTLGSSVSHHAQDVYRHAADACERLARRAVFLTGAAEPRDWPAHVRAVPYAPYSRVMPRCAAVVHHAGIGTVAGALRAGVPQVIIPFANDEFDNAHRVRRLGAGLVLKRRRVSPRRLHDALRRALDDAPMRNSARSLAAAITQEDGPTRAAEALESLVNK